MADQVYKWELTLKFKDGVPLEAKRLVAPLVKTEPHLFGTKAQVRAFLQEVLPGLGLQVVPEKSRRIPIVSAEPFDDES